VRSLLSTVIKFLIDYLREHGVLKRRIYKLQCKEEQQMCCVSRLPDHIEIVNINTRGGIVILIQSKKGNAANGGQKIKMLK
jgi:RNA-binding protein YhbY